MKLRFIGSIGCALVTSLALLYYLSLNNISLITPNKPNQKTKHFYTIHKPKKYVKNRELTTPKTNTKSHNIDKVKSNSNISNFAQNQSSKPKFTPHDKPILITELTQKATIINSILPKYPKKAQKLGIEAQLLLELIINKKGTVEYIDIAYCSEKGYGFEKNAVDAVKKLQFEPFFKDGTPVKVKLVYPVNFILTR